MQALAVCSQFALAVGMLSPRRLVLLALFPLLVAFFYPSLLVKIVGFRGAPLPIHLALQAPLLAGIGPQLLAKCDESGLALAWHDR